jgi:hypothetical protein
MRGQTSGDIRASLDAACNIRIPRQRSSCGNYEIKSNCQAGMLVAAALVGTRVTSKMTSRFTWVNPASAISR